MRRYVLLPLAVWLAACGTGGSGNGDDAEVPGPDANTLDVTVDSGNPQDSGTPPQDGTVPPDATLDVNGDGTIWTADSGGSSGDSGGGGPCKPDGINCVGSTAEICADGGLTTQTCTGGKLCAPGYGCVVCDPGSGTCSGSTGTLCKSDGSGYETNNCDAELGLTCQAGVCVGDCANIGQSYIGCEYYAITSLNNQLNQSTFLPAVTLANTSTKSATVYITGPNTVTGSPFTITAGSTQTVSLPWDNDLSCGKGQTCNGSTVPAYPTTFIETGGAYHIKSNEPITAYQFNAYDYTITGSYSYTNDASLLIPVNALSGNYYVATFPSWLTEPGLIDIVGTQASTSVTVTPTVSIDKGAGLSTSGGTVTLGAGDVLQITTPTPGTSTTCGCTIFGCDFSGCSFGNDMSGSTISANAPVEVFGGHGCTFNPATQYACDHLEQINLPTETLGSDYLVIPPYVNSKYIDGTGSLSKPTHTVKIVGTKASTTLTYDPTPTVISGTASTSVGAGGVVTFETATPFHVTSTNPVVVAMFMEGGNNYSASTTAPTTEYIGDPSQSISVPTGQFRDTYAFTAPSSYYVNYVTLIAKSGNSVKVDSTTIASTSFTAIGSSGYGFYYYTLCDGGTVTTCTSISANHSTSSAAGFGIQVYGYGSYTSYWYPGGLNLTR